MLSFEERLNKHLERIVENTNLIFNDMLKSEDNEIIQESFRIMFAPQNEEELTFSEAYLSLIVNTASVAKKAQTNETIIVPIKENKFVKALIEELKRINIDETDYNYTPYKGLNLEEAIILTYDAATFPGYSDEEIIECLCKNLKIGKNDDNGKLVLSNQLEEIQCNINLRPLADNLEEHMKKVVILSKLFKEFSDSQEIKTESYDETYNY